VEESPSPLMLGQTSTVLHSWQSLHTGLRPYLLELLATYNYIYEQILLDFTGYLDNTLESILLSVSYI
jgi:hypothetical protein